MSAEQIQPDLILVDGSSYLYRAYHALPPLATGTGQPTGAIKGVLSMVERLRKDYAPALMAVVFDAPGPTFRNDIYDDYKANRPPMPDDLRSQIQPLKDAIRLNGLALISEPGVEADDVIGTLARQAVAQGRSVLISTGDKDLAQLVESHITLINTMNNVLLDFDGVLDKFGVPPERIIDYLTLIGDTSDNVPGVPKCGPKTALKWLNAYGDLDGICAHAHEIGGKVGENLRAFLPDLERSRDLVTIRQALDLPVRVDELDPGEPDRAALRSLYESLEFRSWAEALAHGSDEAAAAQEDATQTDRPTVSLIRDLDTLRQWIQKLRESGCFAFDTETTSLDYMQARLVGMSFCIEPGQAAYLPLAHSGEDAGAQVPLERALELLEPLLSDPALGKLGQHLKYDRNVLANHGVVLAGIRHDTMLQSYVLDATGSRHDLDTLASRHLHYQTIHYEDVAGKGAKQIPFAEVPVEKAAVYAGEDAEVCLRLHQRLLPRLEKNPALLAVYEELEIPLVPVLSAMERRGARIDIAALENQSAELAEELQRVEEQAHEVAGEAFNLGSPKQLQAILFERMELPVRQKTPKGQPSTAEGVLEGLAAEGYELPTLILRHRMLSKLRNTYTLRLVEQVNPNSGRVHTSYHQAVTSTGRLSSSEPNLQNIPIRTPEGRRVRAAFVAPPGHKIVSADYSQVELRIMAHFSGDDALLDAFAAGEDIHSSTAAEIFSLRREEVSDEDRRTAKAINFGLIYGMSAFGLARQLKLPRSEAQHYIDRYFERFPGVRRYMDDKRQQARDQGFVETLRGRRLYLPEIKARNPARRQAAERIAINAPMQGTAADIIKQAMLDVDAWLQREQPEVNMILQVHDELIFEVPDPQVDTFPAEVADRMAAAAELRVPLLVETGVGANWDEAH